MKRENNSYLEGELNAVSACGAAIQESLRAIKARKLAESNELFILCQFQQIMAKASGLIEAKNKALGIVK